MFWLIATCGVIALLSILATFRTKVVFNRALAVGLTVSWLLKAGSLYLPDWRSAFIETSIVLDYVLFVASLLVSMSQGRWWHQWIALFSGTQEILSLYLLWHDGWGYLTLYVALSTVLAATQLLLLIAPWGIKRRRLRR